MSRQIYLGQQLSLAGRNISGTVPPPTQSSTGRSIRIPAMTIADPNGEPIRADFALEAADPAFESYRALHLIIVPTSISPMPSTPQEWLAAATPYKADLDVTNVAGQSASLSLPGVPDGDFIAQSVIEAGDD